MPTADVPLLADLQVSSLSLNRTDARQVRLRDKSPVARRLDHVSYPVGYEAGNLRDATRVRPNAGGAAARFSEGVPGGRDRGGVHLVWHSTIETHCRSQYPKGNGGGRKTARLNEHCRDEQRHCHSESSRAQP
jgi:hypothetical protein